MNPQKMLRRDGAPGTEVQDEVLRVEDLKVYFPVTRGVWRRKVADVKAVDGVSFGLRRGEVLGLVGESGCGKTTVGRTIMRLYEPTAGRIFFEGEDITDLSERKLRPICSKMSLIFQDPYSSLDPRQSAGSIVGEPLLIHQKGIKKAQYRERIQELFKVVGLNPDFSSRYPHEFSGGQRQRIGIARALAAYPSLVICDEPISALDVSIQSQVINLLRDLQETLEGLTYIFIAHDLAVVENISDRIAVMYLGHIVEITSSEELYDNALHPYTQALLAAVPVPDPDIEAARERIILKGEVPSPLNPPPGCAFEPRCPMAIPECSQVTPDLREVGPDHEVACIRVSRQSLDAGRWASRISRTRGR